MKAKVRRLILGSVMTNCFILENTETNEAVVIDPADSGDKIYRELKKDGQSLTGVLLTHSHYDHILGLPGLLDAAKNDSDAAIKSVPVYASKEEEELLSDPSLNLSGSLSIKADTYLKDGDSFTLAGFNIVCMLTPGHTKGSCCFYIEDEKLLFCGDTLFEGSIGRTDFPTGSMSVMMNTLKDKIKPLPDDVKVLPGHEGMSTIGVEKKYNPYLNLV